MTVSLPNSHFIDLKDLPSDVLRHILDTAKAWKVARVGLPKGAVDEGAVDEGAVVAEAVDAEAVVEESVMATVADEDSVQSGGEAR